MKRLRNEIRRLDAKERWLHSNFLFKESEMRSEIQQLWIISTILFIAILFLLFGLVGTFSDFNTQLTSFESSQLINLQNTHIKMEELENWIAEQWIHGTLDQSSTSPSLFSTNDDRSNHTS